MSDWPDMVNKYDDYKKIMINDKGLFTEMFFIESWVALYD